MNQNLSVELYKENGHYCAYIGEDGSSGYEIEENSAEDCAERVKQYVINAFVTYTAFHNQVLKDDKTNKVSP